MGFTNKSLPGGFNYALTCVVIATETKGTDVGFFQVKCFSVDVYSKLSSIRIPTLHRY